MVSRDPDAIQIAGTGEDRAFVQWEEVNELWAGFSPLLTLAQVQFSALD